MSSVGNKRKLIEPRRVSKSLFELKVKGTLCDVQLSLQGTAILAHACVLASCSSYFLELFQLNEEVHWCAKSPLVVDLDNLMDNSTGLCVSCISKTVDFMYLRELVISQDHYEHFAIINSLFHIFPLPLGKRCNKTDLCKPVEVDLLTNENLPKKSKIIKVNKISVADCPSKPVIPPLSNKSDTSFNSSLTNKLSCVSEAVKSNDSESGEIKSTLNVSVNGNVILNTEKYSYPVQVSTSTSEVSVKLDKINNETKTKKACEFMCCKSDPDINSCKAKVRKRRIMHCEVCDFSSVSIRKTTQHLQSSDHFKSSCPICLRKVQNINEFNKHLKDHTNSKPFVCHICNKRNRYWDYHKMHLKIHCKNKPFYCDLCQRGFASKRNLTEHLVTHKGSFLCKKCDYYTSDLNMYKSHFHQHEKEDRTADESSLNFQFGNHSDPKTERVKKYQCQICSEKFTQKKNLTRHVKLKHFDGMKLNCSICTFVTTRTDMLRRHMQKQHNCTPVKEKKRCMSEEKLQENEQKSHDFVSVLIPIQLVADNSAENAFATGSCRRDLNKAANTEMVTCINDKNDSYTNSHVILSQNPNVESLFVKPQVTLDRSKELKEQTGSFSLPSDFLEDRYRKQDSITDPNKTEPINNNNSENINSNIKISLMSSSNSFNMDIDSSGSTVIKPQQLNDKDLSLVREGSTINNQENIADMLDQNKYIWLNEMTGELLSDETLANMQAQKPACKADQKVSETENSTIDFCDQLKSAILSESGGEFSSFDLRDDNEEWQYPQTPQASMVGIDDCDNLFPWNQIDNSFYSTWVLNETTGELNMVSFFSIQSVKNHTELKLNENSNESLTSLEDDDTALFLNEGTGDLSVIYFNPNGPAGSVLKPHSNEKPNLDNLETLSEKSDDDNDFLNEEFMRASANFMFNEENQKFLNELTGEFDIANFDNCQPEVINNQDTVDESYLNEETGEISWNIMDNNANNDLFKKPDSLEYDLDDSLNCEDFESFFREVSGFSPQFCLDSASKNWQSGDEASDALVLNECTGELVRRT